MELIEMLIEFSKNQKEKGRTRADQEIGMQITWAFVLNQVYGE